MNIKDISKLKKSYEITIERLKERLNYSMEELNTNELKGSEYCFKQVRSKSKVEIVDADSLPMEYIREKLSYEPDKDKIFKDLEKGKIISGVVLKETKSLRKYLVKNYRISN